MSAKRVRLGETVLRDGHQSILATRMRMSHMLPALQQLDEIGYDALECWGGATFDSCTHVARIVQCVKNTDTVHTVFFCFANECFYYIISLMFVTQ